MMKSVKVGLFGLAMSVIGAVALPAQDAHAQGDSSPNGKSPICIASYAACIAGANGNAAALAVCQMQYALCK
ncbi:hypothetical protein [Cystobacter ferrugineus]|uniref:Uncharacterized protein n=1 Tax=Cystobacter ferrugineus TaxID=83449 RepID=A0A1L9AX67_9BACT|nr:hypothetical protein [Cystobacter ferrugineus]OJH34611.1 hypothetical protein BON30_43240 [Cystobacter ferrugineus]